MKPVSGILDLATSPPKFRVLPLGMFPEIDEVIFETLRERARE